MKTHKPNAELVWKQFTDFLIPHFKLSIRDRAVYSHLLRHSHLEGKRRLYFSIAWLAQGAGLTRGPVRESVRRLASCGAVRLLERGRKGHLIEVRVPEEVCKVPAIPKKSQSSKEKTLARPHRARSVRPASAVEGRDFLQRPELREAIHAREGGRCFYCLRCLNKSTRCLDHVVPRVENGQNSYRNLVSACIECNSLKSETPAGDFLRRLYREGRLTTAELAARLRALKSLAAGKLRPTLPTNR